MFDTMTITKIGGGLCGATLIFLLLNWGAETIYSTEAVHGDGAEAAYVIEIEGDGEETAEDAGMEEDKPDFATILAAADLEKGKKVFAKCKACHRLEEGKKGVGPSLFGILNRDVASADGFSYSGALSDVEGNWTAVALNSFITNPKDFANGTKMKFKGLKKQSDRANLIAYLSTIGN